MYVYINSSIVHIHYIMRETDYTRNQASEATQLTLKVNTKTCEELLGLVSNSTVENF